MCSKNERSQPIKVQEITSKTKRIAHSIKSKEYREFLLKKNTAYSLDLENYYKKPS